MEAMLGDVSNQSLCGWFYFMYILALVAASFQAIMILYNTSKIVGLKGPISTKLIFIFGLLVAFVMLGIAVTNSLFLYSLCDRSLVNKR